MRPRWAQALALAPGAGLFAAIVVLPGLMLVVRSFQLGRSPEAAPLIEAVVAAARSYEVPVVTGRFGERMEVALVNSGPVTLLIDTRAADRPSK